MKKIMSTSYKYNRNLEEPITYYINTEKVTTSIGYQDALEIAYTVIDSLGGDYNYLEDLIDKYESEKDNSFIKEAI